MTKQDYTNHQLGIISNYYDHLDTIMLAKLGELVSELYLADSDKKRDRLWKRVAQAMDKLKVPDAITNHILAERNVETLAKHLQDWLKHAKPRR